MEPQSYTPTDIPRFGRRGINTLICALSGVLVSALYAPPSQAQSVGDPARICASGWDNEKQVIPVYLGWLAAVNSSGLSAFKSNAGASNMFIRNPRTVAVSSTEIICRFDIVSNMIGASISKVQVKDLDFRYTTPGGAPRWDLVTFPNVPESSLTKEQVQDLLARLYVEDVPAAQWTSQQEAKRTQAQPRNAVEAIAQAQSDANAQAEEYLRAQGYDVDAIKKAEAEKTRKYAEPCRRSGGTWGRPTDQYGNAGALGCYHPTGER